MIHSLSLEIKQRLCSFLCEKLWKEFLVLDGRLDLAISKLCLPQRSELVGSPSFLAYGFLAYRLHMSP